MVQVMQGLPPWAAGGVGVSARMDHELTLPTEHQKLQFLKFNYIHNNMYLMSLLFVFFILKILIT